MLVAVTLEQGSDVASPLTKAFLREDALPEFCARVLQGMLNHPRCQSGLPLRS